MGGGLVLGGCEAVFFLCIGIALLRSLWRLWVWVRAKGSRAILVDLLRIRFDAGV